MATTYTWDVFSTLDGYGSYDEERANWGGYWSKQGPELLKHRLAQFADEQRMVFGANTFREQVALAGPNSEGGKQVDPWVDRMRSMPATVVSSTLEGPFDWPNATVESGEAVDIVCRLKQESAVPLRSHGSVSMNRTLMAAGLVDLIQVTIYPVISGQTGTHPIFGDVADFDLELVQSQTLDDHTQELIYRPTLH